MNIYNITPNIRQSNPSYLIRKETPNDYVRTEYIVKQAFIDVEESDHTEHMLVKRIRGSETFIPQLSLVAVFNTDYIIGHIMLSRIEIVSDNKKTEALALAPLAIAPDFQRCGVGSALIREAHKIAAEMGFGISVVLGHKNYYPQFGYRRASAYGISFPVRCPGRVLYGSRTYPRLINRCKRYGKISGCFLLK